MRYDFGDDTGYQRSLPRFGNDADLVNSKNDTGIIGIANRPAASGFGAI
jgi:hypothetical protein